VVERSTLAIRLHPAPATRIAGHPSPGKIEGDECHKQEQPSRSGNPASRTGPPPSPYRARTAEELTRGELGYEEPTSRFWSRFAAVEPNRDTAEPLKYG
jgi:hypothetical protein